MSGWVDGREAGFRFVVSIRPGWVRNYLTYFFVYSVRWVHTCARARIVPVDTGRLRR